MRLHKKINYQVNYKPILSFSKIIPLDSHILTDPREKRLDVFNWHCFNLVCHNCFQQFLNVDYGAGCWEEIGDGAGNSIGDSDHRSKGTVVQQWYLAKKKIAHEVYDYKVMRLGFVFFFQVGNLDDSVFILLIIIIIFNVDHIFSASSVLLHFP